MLVLPYSTMSYEIKALPTVCRLHTMVEKWRMIEATVRSERHYDNNQKVRYIFLLLLLLYMHVSQIETTIYH